jgi:pantetheine-phosphate adenylyltransferase
MRIGRPTVALYAGSFDPVTHGHLDVIRRAAQLFNRLIVGVGQNPDKRQLFSQRRRVALIRPHVRDLTNVRVEAYDGLTIHFARRCGARVIVRGIRDVSDLSNELQQANVNLRIGELETVFLMTTDENVLTSSTYIKQICELGGEDRALIERLVPHNVAQRLNERFRRRKG